MEVLVFAAPLNTLRRPTSQAFPRLRLFVLWFGLLLMSMTSMEASCALRFSPPLARLFFPVLASTLLRVPLPRRACQPRLRLRFAIICSTPKLMIVTGLPTSASIACPGRVPGFSLFQILLSHTFPPHSSRLASCVVYACRFGPKIPTAPSADRSWTNGGITHWSAAAGRTELLGTT